jgi:2-oxoglutarate dehydrogenase E2 component (dihydrolipoamide succinyltransferase)
MGFSSRPGLGNQGDDARMKLDIRIPPVGESITEGILSAWSRQDGEVVQKDEPLFELETDKITMTVNAEQAGRLHIATPAGTKVAIGEVVGSLDTDAAAGASASSAASTPGAAPSAPETLSPAVRRLLEEHRLDPARISGTGKGGRITKEDVLRFLEQAPKLASDAESAELGETAARGLAPIVERKPTAPASEITPAYPPPSKAPATPNPAAAASAPESRQTRKPLSPLRKRIAERMVQSHQTAAPVTTYNEADLSAVQALRERWSPVFEQRHGIKLGLMSFFIKALVDALRVQPEVNAFIEGDEIVTNHFHDIGVAVSTEHGLVVPVLRDADRLTPAQIELGIADLAHRARNRTLTLDDLQGGSITLTNGGVFGSLLSTPMLNPPQSAILGMHTIKKRPVVIEDRIEIRPMMYLALTYDHRLIDGREGVTFLRRVVECIENPERMMLDV